MARDREAIRRFAEPGHPFATSPWTILALLPLAVLAGIYASEGWAFVGIFLAPHLVLPGVLAFAAVLYVGIEVIAGIARLVAAPSYLRLLAACALVSFGLGVLPTRITHVQRKPMDLLLEQYAESLLAFAVLLYLAASLWWFISRFSRGAADAKRSGIALLSALVLVAAPFALFGVAQTSRLHDAAATGDLDKLRRALKPWKSIDGVDAKGRTPLRIALNRGSLETAAFLLERGASPQITLRSGERIDLLADAVRSKRTEFVGLFLERGGKLDYAGTLHAAVANGDVEIARICLERGASPNEVLFEAVSPYRRTENRFQLVELLLKHGADPGLKSASGRLLPEAALYASPTYDAQMFEHLLKNGFPANARNKARHTLLYLAARQKNLEAVRLLLAYGADANDGGTECSPGGSCTAHFRTALHEAVLLPSTLGKYSPELGRELVKELVKHGARVDVGDPQGNTPLIVAVRGRNLAGVQALIEAGADPRLGLRDRTPLVLAEKLDDAKFREALAQANLRRIDEARKARAPTIGQRFSPPYGTATRPAR